MVVLTLNPAELLRQSRDAGRLSDLSTLTSAINLYNTDQSGASTYSLGSSSNTYLSIPDPTASTTCGGLGGNFSSGGYFTCATATSSRAINGTGWIPINFSNISAGSPVGTLPVDPVNSTSSNEYYSYQTNGTTFRIVATPESQKYAAAVGVSPLMFVAGSNPTLDGGTWVSVPGNSTFGTNNFYVMKYDAGCSDGNGNAVNTPADTAGGTPGGYNNSGTGGVNCASPAALPGALPIVDITETTAKTSCASIGAHLLTNDEYMTIVTNAANQGSNWTGNAIGTGGMYLGNASNGSEYPADANDQNGWAGETSKTYTNPNDERRTYTLSNGSVIWDISGNVWEWTQRSTNNQGDNQSGSYVTPTCAGTAWAGCEYGSTAVGTINPITSYGTIPQFSIAPPNASWNTTQGMGRVYTGNGANGGGAFVRGGNWGNGASAGPFSLLLYFGPADVSNAVGFRCAR